VDAVSNLEYHGHNSTTLKLVLLGFLTGTALVLSGHISGSEWVAGVLGLLAGYVVQGGVKAAAEAYRDKDKP
jgi:hypothetical protein